MVVADCPARAQDALELITVDYRVLEPVIDPATARMDINLIAPMIFKRYAKPFIHWTLDPLQPFQLTKGQIEAYIAGMKSTLENLVIYI
jgi:hypothetical protein